MSDGGRPPVEILFGNWLVGADAVPLQSALPKLSIRWLTRASREELAQRLPPNLKPEALNEIGICDDLFGAVGESSPQPGELRLKLLSSHRR